MRLAYADPPYPGKAHLYPEKAEVDHAALIGRLGEYDGWALSTDEPALAHVLSLCPPSTRVLAWCKSDAPPRMPYPWFSHEFVLCRPARLGECAVRSYFVGPAPPRGFCGDGKLIGAKSPMFCEWVLRCLGATGDLPQRGDSSGSGPEGAISSPLGLGGRPAPSDRRSRRCAYCGHLLEWRDPFDRWASIDGTCRHHRDLIALDPLRDPVLRCRMMDSPEADLPRMSDELRDAVQATEGSGG